MAAPEYVPLPPTARPRTYTSPDVVPGAWMSDRPAELEGRQPEGTRLGFQGPDQGYALKVADERFRDRIQLADGEQSGDAMRGCVGIAMRRASMFGRAPVVHDLTIAFTIWGFLDEAPPEPLVALRRRAFEGVDDVAHHYAELRAIVDAVPEATLRRSHGEVQTSYPARWRELLGLETS
jgi:hypothetical protein